jgi:hypothetical protein
MESFPPYILFFSRYFLLLKKKTLKKTNKKGMQDLRKLSKAERHAIYQHYTSKNQFYCIEYSVSGSAKCRGCHSAVSKGSLRIRHVVCGNRCFSSTMRKGSIVDTCGRWHLACFLQNACKSKSKENGKGGKGSTDDEKDKREKEKAFERFAWTNEGWDGLYSVDQLIGFEEIKEKDQAQVKKDLEDALSQL